jgi:acetyl esterase/lipase
MAPRVDTFQHFCAPTDDYISPMALDPELLPFLGGPDNANMDEIASSRAIDAALIASAIELRPPPPMGLLIRDEVVTGESHGAVAIRLYRREDLPPSAGAFLFIHGGAFVFGNLESEHDRCVYYAQTTDVIVVSVDYRLAPEFPYPTGHDDVWTALQWLVANAQELGVDPSRICIGGASAGGSLAAGIVLRCRDEGGPHVAAQLLIYPVLDDRGTSLSMATYEVYDPWDGERSRKMWPLYLGHDGDAPVYAAPARANDLRGLPPTFIMSCEEDPLRDEELAFGQRLLQAGVSVEMHHYRGTYHAFDVIAPETAVSRRALSEQALFLQREVGTPSV